MDAPFEPACVIILEGALSYCADFLRKKFPGAKIGVIRFCADFADCDSKWDFALNGAPLGERLFDALGEEGLFATLFYEWPPSARAWPQETKNAWNEIKAATQKAATVLATREHFGKRWLKNKIRFFERIQSAAVLQKIKRPVVICASGPSLEDALGAIKKAREKIFLCALSSSLGALARNKIAPDLCLSCDGGFWAKKHLDILRTEFAQSPLALATEAALPAVLFKEKTIVPLCYDDDALSKDFFAALDIPFVEARRNGTVSGTALELFLKMAEGPIFFCGLDLQSCKKASHARPNALEILSQEKDFRLAPKATRAARASLTNQALDIYADWFSNCPLSGKNVFRIKGSEPFKRSLGQIKDISAAQFESAVHAAKNSSAPQNFLQGQNAAAHRAENSAQDKKKRKETIRRVFDKWQNSETFLTEQFPADSVMVRREKDAEAKKSRAAALQKKRETLAKEIFKD